MPASTSAIRQSTPGRQFATSGDSCARFGEPDTARHEVVPAIVVQSQAMETIVANAEAVAKTDSTILITGESGVGKDVLARFIHAKSLCAPMTMITVNCGAVQETLFEAEFFGYEKGAFTGAGTSKIGLLEAADGSTLFLDEIGELPLSMQVKLLRFLEDSTFRRVGATKDRRAVIRIIAATNKNLEQAVREGTFRADLYYRLNVITLDVPPLRERREEISELAEGFLTSFRSRFKRPHLTLSNEARRALQNFNWPGNVRQLRNCLERACALALDDVITAGQLTIADQTPLHVVNGIGNGGQHYSTTNSNQTLSLVGRHITLAELERAHIRAILTQTKHNRDKAAAILGISSRTLYRKLKENGLEDESMKASLSRNYDRGSMKNQSPQTGFSLIELLIVVTIIAIIAAIAIPNLLASRRAANEASAQQSMRTISSCEHAYYFTYGNNNSYADLPTLGSRIMTDNVLSSGDKSGYHFAVTPEVRQYWATAFPITSSGIAQTGTHRFAITEDGVLRGDLDLSGAPTSHASVLAIPPMGN